MAEREVGSIYIRVRPDAKRFRKDAQDDIGRDPIYVDGHVVTDPKQVDREVDDMQTHADRKKVTVEGELDINDSLRSIEKSMQGLSSLGESMETMRMELSAMRRDLESISRSMTRINVGVGREEVDQLIAEVKNIQSEVNVDATEARKTAKEVGADIDGAVEPRTLTLRYDNRDFDEINQAISTVDRELDALRDRTELEVEVDEDSLNQARESLISLRNEAKISFEVDDNEQGLRQAWSRLRTAWQRLQEPLQIDVEADEDSLQKAMDRIESQIHMRREHTIEVDLTNLDGVRDAIETLNREVMSEVTQKTYTVNIEDGSLHEALDELEDRRMVLTAEADFAEAWDEAHQLNAELDLIPEPRTLTISADTTQFNSLTDGIRQIDRELENLRENLHLEVDIDENGLNEARERLEALREDSRITFEVETTDDGIREAIRRLRSAWQEQQVKLTIDVDADPEELMERIKGLESELAIRAEAREAYETFYALKADLESQGINIELDSHPDVLSAIRAATSMKAAAEAATTPVELDVDFKESSFWSAMAKLHALGATQRAEVGLSVELSGLARAEAALLALSRDRVVRLRTTLLHDRIWRNLTGGFASMAGMGDMQEIVNTAQHLIQNLDVIGTQAVTAGTIVGSVANVMTHALGGVMTTVADLSAGFGLLAAAPTAILAAWAGFHVHRTIWQDFEGALQGIPEVLARLPPNAVRAVESINALSEAVNRSVQDGFWGEMNDEITRFAEQVGPVLQAGMQRTSEIYGRALSDMLDLTQQWAQSGELASSFGDINRMFEGIGNGVVEFFDAFMTVGLRASRFMPRLGFEFERLGENVNEYMQWAAETGKIEQWITSGVNVLEQLRRIGVSTTEMLQGLTQAFRNAGIGGLPAFVEGMEAAAAVMQSPAWQMRMGTIFEGMADGARATWEGVREIASALYESYEWASELARVIGDVSFEALARTAEVIGNTTFQGGMLDLFRDSEAALQILQPGFQSLAEVLGWIGTLSGQIIREMAPGINTMLGIFEDMATGLGPQLVQMVDPLTRFIDNLGHAFRSNLNFVMPFFQALLEGFNSLPEPIQNFLALYATLGRYMPAMGAWFSGLANNVNKYRRAAQAATGATIMGGFSAMRAWPATLNAVNIASRAAAGAVRSLWGAVGGLPGILLMGGITLFANIRADAADARREIEGMTRAILDGGESGLRQQIVDMEGMGEVLVMLGETSIDTSAMLDRLVADRGIDGLVDDFSSIETAIKRAETSASDFSGITGGLGSFGPSDETLAALDRMGLSWEEARELGSGYFTQVREGLEGLTPNIEAAYAQADAVRESAAASEEAAEKTRHLGSEAKETHSILVESGEELEWASEQALSFAQNLTQAADSSSTMESRVQALSQATRTLSGDYEGFSSSGADAWSAVEQAIETAGQAHYSNYEDMGKGAADLEIENGKLSDSFEDMSHRQVDALGAVTEMHEAYMAKGLSAYDAVIDGGGTAAEASDAAMEAMTGWEGDVNRMAEAMGLNEEQTAALRETYRGFSNEDFAVSFALMGLSEEDQAVAMDAIGMLEGKLEGVSREEWAVHLAAYPEQAYVAIADAELAASNYASIEAVATLGADHQDAFAQMAQAMGMGEEYAAGDYSAILVAMTDTAENDLESLIDEAMEWEGADGERMFTARDEASSVILELLGLGHELDEDVVTTLREEGGKTIMEALENLNVTIENLDTSIRIAFGIDDPEDAKGQVEGFGVIVDDHPDEADTTLKLNDSLVFDEGMKTAKGLVEDFPPEASTQLQLKDSFVFGDGMGEAGQSVDDHPGEASTQLKLTDSFVFNGGLGTAKESVDNVPDEKGTNLTPLGLIPFLGGMGSAKESTNEVPGLVETGLGILGQSGFLGGMVNAGQTAKENIPNTLNTALSVLGLGGFLGGTGSAKEGAESIPNEESTNLFSTGDLLTDALSARDSVLEIPGSRSTTFNFLGNLLVQVRLARDAIAIIPKAVVVRLTAASNIAEVAGASRAAVAGIPSKHVTLMASGNIAAMAQTARVAVANIPSKHVTLMASGNIAQHAATAMAMVGRVRSKQIRLMASGNVTPFARRAINMIRGLRSKRVTLAARGNATRFAQNARRAMLNVPNVYRSINVRSNAWSVARSAQWSINSVRGKTVTITTRRRTIGAHAEGGLYAGGLQHFAHGGFKENHKAMIAQATPDLRVWAEPETGGEAYIPLAASKRARSTAIWQETGKRLGVYANGGVNGGQSGPQAPDGPTFNITNHYPQAEPNSRTVARTMEQIGSGAGGRW